MKNDVQIILSSTLFGGKDQKIDNKIKYWMCMVEWDKRNIEKESLAAICWLSE